MLLIAGVYLAARFSKVSWSGAIGILLVVGAVHGLAALLVQLPGGESLIPIVPQSTGAVVGSERAVGLYANPNTLGNVAAITSSSSPGAAPGCGGSWLHRWRSSGWF